MFTEERDLCRLRNHSEASTSASDDPTKLTAENINGSFKNQISQCFIYLLLLAPDITETD